MSETPQQYTQRILDNAAGKDALRVQRGTAAQLKKLTKGLDKKQLRWRPAAGQWSIAEILAHLAETDPDRGDPRTPRRYGDCCGVASEVDSRVEWHADCCLRSGLMGVRASVWKERSKVVDRDVPRAAGK